MLALLLDTLLKGTVLLLAAGALTLALRRAAAAARHLVWAVTFAGLLALPVGSALLPAWRVPAWPRVAALPAVSFDAVALPAAPSSGVVTPPAAAAPRTTPPVTPIAVGTSGEQFRLRPVWTTLLLPLWLAGMTLVLAALVVALARIAWIARTAFPVRDPAWHASVSALARSLAITRPVRLLRAAGSAMPMTWGLFRPVILVPADADLWSAERRRDVLLHELAHVKRYDFATQLLTRIACACYWINPLVWLAATRLRVERERACDDHVLRAGTLASDYAGHLLAIARSLHVAPGAGLASVAMARPSQLAGRLLDVLDASRPRSAVPARIAVPAWLIAAAVVLPLAAAAPARVQDAAPAAAPATVRQEPAAAPRARTGAGQRSRGSSTTIRQSSGISTGVGVGQSVSVTTSSEPGEAVPSADSLRGCPVNRGPARHSHHQVNDGMIISTTVGRCDVHLTVEGRFTFNDDFSDIATISRGGHGVIAVDYGDHVRRLELQPAAGGAGTLERVYKVDGAVQPFDADARAWLAETLTFLLRQSGAAAEQRAPWILAHRGISGLLDEITHLGGDYARRQYYQVAVESGKLDAAGFERIVTEAGRDIDSDYELAELLIAVAEVQPLTAGMQTGFVTAARAIESDYEKRRVLEAVLSRPDLSTAAAGAMLQTAADIESDYELAELLIDINRAHPIEEALRPAYFAAVNTIESDYERGRTLKTLLGRRDLPKAVVLAVLESGKGIDSDYELAELLLRVVRTVPVDESVRAAVFEAAKGIESTYEHDRVMAALARRSGRAELE
jgi:beta-lactamase regulating signal transducer with metallopeptidase domain